MEELSCPYEKCGKPIKIHYRKCPYCKNFICRWCWKAVGLVPKDVCDCGYEMELVSKPSAPTTGALKAVVLNARKFNRFGDGAEVEGWVGPILTLEFKPRKNLTETLMHLCGAGMYSSAESWLLENHHKLGRLQKDEVLSLWVYTYEGNFYKDLNTVMRFANREKEKKQLDLYLDYIYYLKHLLGQLESFQDYVYRGIGCVVDEYRPGKEIIWSAFTSASKYPWVALNFVRNKKSKGTLFVIKSKNAKSIEKYSAIEEEGEALFTFNSRFKILREWGDSEKRNLLSLDDEELNVVKVLELAEI